MKQPTVSIIIPARSAESYIEQCVKSTQSQTYSNIDIVIVINDSSDQTEAICKKLKSKDSRIQVVTTAKAGVSHARNLGIKSALGDYLLFVDADDYIHEDMVKHLLAKAIKHKADIVAASFEKYHSEKLGSNLLGLEGHLVSSADFTQSMLLRRHGYDGYSCGKLYSKNIVAGIRFDETLKFSEDTDFLLRLLRQNANVYISSFIGYFYSQNTGGITKDAVGSERIKSLKVAEKFINDAGNAKIRPAAECYYWRSTYYILSQSTLSPKDEDTIWEAMKRYRMVVIKNSASPMKYRLIAAASILGKPIFKMLTSRRVSRKQQSI